MEIDLPEHIKKFIDEVVDSFVTWDLLIFASQKMTGIESPGRTAQLLGRSEAEVEKPYLKLAKLGILVVEKKADGGTSTRVNQTSLYYEELQKFLSFNDVQENRLRILSYLLQKKVH